MLTPPAVEATTPSRTTGDPRCSAATLQTDFPPTRLKMHFWPGTLMTCCFSPPVSVCSALSCVLIALPERGPVHQAQQVSLQCRMEWTRLFQVISHTDTHCFTHLLWLLTCNFCCGNTALPLKIQFFSSFYFPFLFFFLRFLLPGRGSRCTITSEGPALGTTWIILANQFLYSRQKHL